MFFSTNLLIYMANEQKLNNCTIMLATHNLDGKPFTKLSNHYVIENMFIT